MLNFIKHVKLSKILMLTLAGVINAVGVTVFLAPVNLYDSGISGTSMLLGGVSGLPLSVFLVLLNVPLSSTVLKSRAVFSPFTLFTPSASIR